MTTALVREGDAREVLSTFEADTVDCVVTSPPYYGHRTYGGDSTLGREQKVDDYVEALAGIFAEVLRVLKPTGTCFVNLGESYQAKRALLVPQRIAVALAGAGWIVRNEITWVRTNVRPESAKDRLTNATEVVLFCTKEPSGYYFNPLPLREPAEWNFYGRQTSQKGRALATGGSWQSENPDRRAELARTRSRHPRNVWTFPAENRPNNGLAPFPEELPRRCLLLGCPERGLVLDPFAGTGTTLVVARALGMDFVGIDVDPAAVAEMRRRLGQLTIDQEAV
jgi:site-specific DNA-methyltransferase (adenine-specific)